MLPPKSFKFVGPRQVLTAPAVCSQKRRRVGSICLPKAPPCYMATHNTLRGRLKDLQKKRAPGLHLCEMRRRQLSLSLAPVPATAALRFR